MVATAPMVFDMHHHACDSGSRTPGSSSFQELMNAGTSRGDDSNVAASSMSPSVSPPPDLNSELDSVHEHGSSTYPTPPPREILDAAGELLRALAAPVRIAIVLQLRES